MIAIIPSSAEYPLYMTLKYVSRNKGKKGNGMSESPITPVTDEEKRIYEAERLREAARLDEREWREELEEEKDEIKNMWKAIQAGILIVSAMVVVYLVFFL